MRGGSAGEPARRSAGERALVVTVEMALRALLLGLLSLAVVKFHGMLGHLGIAWWKGLPVTLAFAAAALWSGRGVARGAAELRKGRSV